MLPGILLLLFVFFVMGWIVLSMLPKIVELNTRQDLDESESPDDHGDEGTETEGKPQS